MQTWDNAFDRDIGLFEASRMLSLPTSIVQDLDQVKSVLTSDKNQVRKFFPLLFKELCLDDLQAGRFELYLLKERARTNEQIWEIQGEARVYIFSSTPSAPWRAGTCLKLSSDESLKLERRFYRNHFIGIIREATGR